MKNSLPVSKGFTLLFLLYANFCFAQKNAGIIVALLESTSRNISNTPNVLPEFHDGFIVINSDTINGSFKFSGNHILQADSIDKKRYKIKEVTSARLFAADPLITKNGFMDFVHIGKPSALMYRQIHCGSFEIYDRTYYTNEIPGYIGDWVIMDAGEILPHGKGFPSQKRYLVNCINDKFCMNLESWRFNNKLNLLTWLKLKDSNLGSHRMYLLDF